MINASELRIGNYIRSNPNGGDGTVIRLHTIGNSTVHGESLDGQLKNLKIDLDRWNEPIPLTPEILQKCGFDKNEDAGNWHSPEHTIYSTKGISVGVKGDYIGWYNSSEDDFYSSYYPQLKYVHQLQNLYFALTGNELKIDL